MASKFRWARGVNSTRYVRLVTAGSCSNLGQSRTGLFEVHEVLEFLEQLQVLDWDHGGNRPATTLEDDALPLVGHAVEVSENWSRTLLASRRATVGPPNGQEYDSYHSYVPYE